MSNHENLSHDGEEEYSPATSEWIDRFIKKVSMAAGIKEAEQHERRIPVMYKSFAEMIETARNSDDDELKDFSYCLELFEGTAFFDEGEESEIDISGAPEVYAQCLFFLNHDHEKLKEHLLQKQLIDQGKVQKVSDLIKLERKSRNVEGVVWDGGDLFSFINSDADYDKYCDYLNSVMHIMHTKEPELRNEGIEAYTELLQGVFGREYVEDLTGEVFFGGYDGLTGKDIVDDSITEAITGWLSPLKDDVVVRIYPTWMYSHLDCGDDYEYDRPESIRVEINATNKQARDMAVEILNSKGDELREVMRKNGLRPVIRY